jgi:hypothetical protein
LTHPRELAFAPSGKSESPVIATTNRMTQQPNPRTMVKILNIVLRRIAVIFLAEDVKSMAASSYLGLGEAWQFIMDRSTQTG